MSELILFSAGAAQGVVMKLAPDFRRETGFEISGTFNAVGATAARLRSGEVADMAIVTAAVADQLIDEGLLQRDGRADIGKVETSVAIRAGDPPVCVADGAALRAALCAADAIYLPDVAQSTAGIHLAKVIERLGIATELKGKLRIFVNGATAMRALAASAARRPIGCTQATEIVDTRGVTLVGALPPGYDLATVYSAAITAHGRHNKAAGALIRMLADPAQQELRGKLGFADIVLA